MADTTIRRPLTAGQKKLLDAMPELADSKFPEVHATVPASNYIDPARFEDEKKAVFRSAPVIAAPSGLLREGGAFHAVDITGMPVLLAGQKGGGVRAFINVCRHRGAKLCPDGETLRANRIVCPYHAWSYTLEGRLMGLPRPETFPGLNK
ncbi:MAG: Rieske (2Fe-2S) protein, partial [Sphingomonadales bacterium]